MTLLAACGSPAEPSVEARAPVTASLPPAAILTPAQQAKASAAHDQFATAGISCATCHPCGGAAVHGVDWMDTASTGFHAVSANGGITACQGCHGAKLDGVGGSTSIACSTCHGASWTTSCTMCHGGTDTQTGAPPKATWGNTGDAVRVGAHTPHLAGSARSPAMACSACHVVPADALAASHLDGATAEVTFGGLAVNEGAGAAWDRPSATCTNVYCHGATLSGGTQKSPVWTGGAAEAACGTCHGAPPPSPHPAAATLAACATCHPATVDSTGTLVPPSAGGLHLDGVVEKTSYHPAGWMDQTSTGFHASSANAGLSSCQSCHGNDLAGGTAGVACSTCHGASWTTSCTMCHGGSDNQTGAPPKATWGNAADTVRTGTHTAHVGATHGLAKAVDCGVCHVKPASALSTGHLGAGPAEVAFSGLATTGTTTAPTWSRGTATCAGTYCHGATLVGGAQKTPVWTTANGTQRACGSCHGAPPANAFHTRTDLGCGSCHTGYSATTVSATLHVDSKLDYSVTCASCHGDSTRAPTTLNPQLAAAPPADTKGATATTGRGVGAHQAHLTAGTISNGFACTECHVVPTSMLHANGAVALTWGTLAKTGSSVPAWTASTATCATNWCHGAKLTGGSDTTPVWTTVNGTQDACGTCHGRPPSSGQHSKHRSYTCAYCHTASYSSTAVDKAVHVNGLIEVKGSRITTWNASTKACTPTCHGSENWR